MTAAVEPTYDEPGVLAGLVAALPAPLLVCTDIDGTLSAIVPTPGEARLVDGAIAALRSLVAAGIDVAVVSGRPMAELIRQFGLPRILQLVGSHGVEFEQAPPRTDRESEVLESVDALLADIAGRHPGAEVERKPFAAALHVRRCAPDVGDAALREAHDRVDHLDGAYVLDGHRVCEVVVRPVTKVDAIAQLQRRADPAATVFLGDDQSDELVFAAFADGDGSPAGITLGIKVGPGCTAAVHRLRSPDDAVACLQSLADLLAG